MGTSPDPGMLQLKTTAETTTQEDTACPRCDGAQVNNEHWCCGGSFSPGETCWPPVGGSTPAPSPSTPPPGCEINGVYNQNAPDGCSGYGCGICEPLNMIAKFDDPGANQCSITSAEFSLGGTKNEESGEWENPNPNCCYVGMRCPTFLRRRRSRDVRCFKTLRVHDATARR